MRLLTIIFFVMSFGFPSKTEASPGVHVCNGSTSMSVYLAKAWQRGYAGNYVVTGWHELQPAPIKLLRQCSTIGYGFDSPNYVTIAHRDEAGRMSIYSYEFEAYGGYFQIETKWLCVSLDSNFSLDGYNLKDLSSCPKGMVRAPFKMRINAPESDDDITLYVAEAGQSAEKLITFDELAKKANAPPKSAPQDLPPIAPRTKPSLPVKPKIDKHGLLSSPLCINNISAKKKYSQSNGRMYSPLRTLDSRWNLELFVYNATLDWVVLGTLKSSESTAKDVCILASGKEKFADETWYAAFFQEIQKF